VEKNEIAAREGPTAAEQMRRSVDPGAASDPAEKNILRKTEKPLAPATGFDIFTPLFRKSGDRKIVRETC
jgi:hypothetical protein